MLIKEDTLIKQVTAQFVMLIQDTLLLVMSLLIFVFVIRAKTLYERMGRFIQNKKERHEIKVLNFIERITSKQEVDKEEEKKEAKKMKITDLNKNVCSVLFPYNDHKDLLRMETANKKAYLLVNFWPVWKNKLEECFVGNEKID